VVHTRQIFNCPAFGCGNNRGKGYADKSSLKFHIRDTHVTGKSNCTIPSYGNNKGKGYPTHQSFDRHIQLMHLDKNPTALSMAVTITEEKVFKYAI
jgi:hypothetical protein